MTFWLLGQMLYHRATESRGSLNLLNYTAISRKIVGKMYTRQSRKAIWDMINTLFLMTVAVEPTFVAFH